jgi:UDP-N-acetyl-D-mannosaminuronate dehydrogenase
LIEFTAKEKSVAIVGSQPEALLLSVLFAEAGVSNFLVGNFERGNGVRTAKNSLEEARWLLGLHSRRETITLVPSIDELPLAAVKNLVLTAHTGDVHDSSLQEHMMRTISKNITRDTNIIFTGLSRPGHTSAKAEQIQRLGGLRFGQDIGLYYLPLLWNGESPKTFKETPRIIAGAGHSVQPVLELFLRVFPSISTTERIRAAEAAGLFAPVYKDVVGALEVELARLCVGESVHYSDALSLCQGLGLSALGAPRSFPGRDSVASEIALSITRSGAGSRLIRAARHVNEESDRRVVAMVKNALEQCGQRLRHSKIAVLGLDGLGVNETLRPEPIGLFQTLNRRGASISLYLGSNSYFSNKATFGEKVRVEPDIMRAVEKAHCALVALNSTENGDLNPMKMASEMSRPAAICDLTGVLEASNVERAGLFYTSIGRGISEA